MSKIQEKFSLAKEKFKELGLDLIVSEKDDNYYSLSIRNKEQGQTHFFPGGWSEFKDIEDLSHEEIYAKLRKFVDNNVL